MNPVTMQWSVASIRSSVPRIEYYRSPLITACCLVISLFAVLPIMAADGPAPPAPEKSSERAPRLDATRHELLGRLLKDLETRKLPAVVPPKAPVREQNTPKTPSSPEPARRTSSPGEEKAPLAERAKSNEPATETAVVQPGAVEDVDELLLEDDLSDARSRIEQLRQMLQALREGGDQNADGPRPKTVRLAPARELKTELPDVPAPAEPYGSEAEIGLLLVDMGRYEEALQHLEIGAKLDLDPEDMAWLQLRRAICLRRLGKLKQAQQVAQNLRLSWPDSHWATEAEWLISSIKWLEQFNLNRPDVTGTVPEAGPAVGGQKRSGATVNALPLAVLCSRPSFA